MPAPPMVNEGKHPAYLHALTDLRAARAHLHKPGNSAVKWDEKKAIREIDGAIDELKHASIDDGKNIEDHPPIDEGMQWGGRLQKALELVRKARADMGEEEDNAPGRVTWRMRANHRLRNEAERFIE